MFPASPYDLCLKLKLRLQNFAGTLKVKLLENGSETKADITLPSSDRWIPFYVPIRAEVLRKPFKLAFEGEVRDYSTTWWQNMNLDDVSTVPKSCPNDGGCSFEVTCKSWKDVGLTHWKYGSAANRLHEGPPDDHTFANKNGKYMFINGTKIWATLTSDILPEHHCLSFWFYCSLTSCALRVFQRYNSNWAVIWDSSTHHVSKSQWTLATVPLKRNEDGVLLSFIGFTGNAYGVVAVDDIDFRNTTCLGGDDYMHGAVANMSKQTTGFANLESPLFCTENYLDFRLNITYKINCQDGACLLEVLQNDTAETMTLWTTTTHSVDTQTHSLTAQPNGDTFSIIIRAKKLNKPGWALEILVDSVSLEPGELITSTAPESTTAVPGASAKETQDDSSDGLAVGVCVSIGVVILVVAVVVVVVWRRKKNNSNNKKHDSPGIKSESPSEILTPAIANAAYSPDTDPDSVHLATNGVDNTYAKVNKPRKVNDVYSVPNKGPKAAASRVAANSDEGDGAEADHYSVPDDADSSKRKGDNGYELAAAKLSMAPNTTPRNTGLNKAKGSVGSKTSRGFNPGAGREDEYNKLSLQTPRVASPAMPDTDNTYNHLDEHKHGDPTDQTGGNEYSLAKPDEAVSSKSTDNSRRQDYVNVNPNTSPREDEYHNLDFDSGHAPNSAIRSTGTTGGQDEYNHLQADGPGFRVQGEDDHYNALDFDSHGQVQKGDDGMVYSHLDDDQSAV